METDIGKIFTKRKVILRLVRLHKQSIFSFHHYLDHVIAVYAPAAMRIQRAMQRDDISRDQVSARMDKQIDETIKMKLCDYVIVNDEQQLVIQQLIALDFLLRNELC